MYKLYELCFSNIYNWYYNGCSRLYKSDISKNVIVAYQLKLFLEMYMMKYFIIKN